MVDADGSPRAYGPPGTKPLDFLANAGHPGNWWAVVTDNGKPSGNPILQGRMDPCPGYYISPTTYQHRGFRNDDPLAYVDSERVIYIVVPSHWRKLAKGVVLGCKATVRRISDGKQTNAVVADLGPRSKAGEASIACCEFFGVPSSPKSGGTSNPSFAYTFFPGIAAPGYELKPM